jgi:ATP-dependent DNA helicase RecQ
MLNIARIEQEPVILPSEKDNILLQQILKQYWNYNAFRPLQEDIINTVMEGKDCFAMLPTGGGKSVCYQVPALAKDGFCLVVSPLIALMQDQVMQLRNRGVDAAFIHSGMTAKQLDEVLYQAARGSYKLLYVSPERIQSELFQAYLEQFNVNLIAVDEAHCISQWGHDFRPAYRLIADLKKWLPDVPVMALTASANTVVQADIIEQLQLKDPNIFKQSIVRENLFYHIEYSENKPGEISTLLRPKPGSGILYCRSRKRCVEAALQLQQEGFDAGVYHAGLAREERDFAQAKWTQSNEQIICATTAFGMGIDKPNVRLVMHYDLPDNLEEYYQEAGRAGRDGNTANAYLFYNPRDIANLEASTDIKYPSAEYLQHIYHLVGDFMKMPVGEGYDELLPFDAIVFIQVYKLEMLKTLNAIKLLDREGFWIWNENASTETIIEFTTDRDTLNYLEKTHPKLAYVATGLLRLYGSVYHFPTAIRPFDVAKMLRIEKPQLDEALRQLDGLSILKYQPAVSGGTLYWMHDRIAKPMFRLDMKRIDTLKKSHQERVSKMIEYVTTDDVCRNILLSQYFGETAQKACGHCDVCLRQKGSSVKITDSFRNQLMEHIKAANGISIFSLQSKMPEIQAEQLIQQVRLLNDEGLCSINAAGVIFAVSNSK